MKITDKRVDTKYPLFKQDLQPGMVVECDMGIVRHVVMVPYSVYLVDLNDGQGSMLENISQGKSFREVDAELVIRSKGDE